MKRLLCLSDQNDLIEEYDQYVIGSENFINTIELCKKNDMPYIVLENPWKSNEQIYQAKEYLHEIKDQIVLYASQLLNDYHGTNYTVKEWNVLLGSWLDVFLEVLYEKYMILKTVENFRECCDVQLVNEEVIVAPIDYTDFIDMVYFEEQYNLYILSQILKTEDLCKNLTVIDLIHLEKPEIRMSKKTKGYYKTLVYRFMLRTIKLLTGVKDKVVLKDVYLPAKFMLKMMEKSSGQIVPYMRDYLRIDRPKFKYEIDNGWRNLQVEGTETEDSFVILVKKLLKKNIPVAYVEEFDYLQKRARKQYKYAMQPRAVFYVNEGISIDEVCKNYLMQIRHTDVFFCDMQHGGNYGIDPKSEFFSERDISDWMYTWGWQRENDDLCKYKPMPASKTMWIGEREWKKEYILYVNYCAPKNPIAISPMSLFYMKDQNRELEFLQQLPKELRNQMLVRLFQNDLGWNLRKIFTTKVPDLKYDTEADYYESMRKAKLVVLSRWSTTILEALAVNKPIIVLRDNPNCDEEAASDLEELKRVGILVDTWESLADQLSSIYEHVDEWWDEPERQAVVKKIREKYIYAPINAKKIWVDELMRFCN